MASRKPDAETNVMGTTNQQMIDEGTTPGVTYETESWEATRSVDRRADLSVGDCIEFSKRLTEEEVGLFARISGDTNRLHLDDEFAEETRFGGPIAHGTLVSGLISAALARLPGVVVYLSQDTSFQAPAGIGGTLTAKCELVEDLGDFQFRLTTIVSDETGTTLVDGEAVVLVDELPEEADESV